MPIVVQISSGLGNQMFQYASAYAIARENGQKLWLDPAFEIDFRHYQLDNFYIECRKKLLPFKIQYKMVKNHHVVQVIRWLRKKRLKHYELYREREQFAYDSGLLKNKKNVYLEGYWQSWKYFDKYKKEIKQQFIFKKELSAVACEWLEKVIGCESVAVHVRRTDYITTLNNACVLPEFYFQAIAMLVREKPNLVFFIFSDDKEYVERTFDKISCFFVNNCSDIEEFEIMRACKHHVIANSTFSWWAAYLGSDSDGVVIAPKMGRWNRDFYLPEWMVLEAAGVND